MEFLVVGLGNPGPRYAGNRHNVGFLVLDELADRLGARFKAHSAVAKTQAEVAEGRLANTSVALLKPRTYMNLSGGPVAALARFYKLPADAVIVVHDELDLPHAVLRLKRGGGEGGHNGLRSISQSLGTKDYVRVRFGIGRPPGRTDAVDYVLQDFTRDQQKDLALEIDRCADAVESVVEHGLEFTQNRLH